MIMPSAQATDWVELKLSTSNKIVFKFMFKNGSITDPSGKEGLAALTGDVIGDGGTSTLTSTQLKDFIYPMASRIDSNVDKEVSFYTEHSSFKFNICSRIEVFNQLI
jgi:zinc protease